MSDVNISINGLCHNTQLHPHVHVQPSVPVAVPAALGDALGEVPDPEYISLCLEIGENALPPLTAQGTWSEPATSWVPWLDLPVAWPPVCATRHERQGHSWAYMALVSDALGLGFFPLVPRPGGVLTVEQPVWVCGQLVVRSFDWSGFVSALRDGLSYSLSHCYLQDCYLQVPADWCLEGLSRWVRSALDDRVIIRHQTSNTP